MALLTLALVAPTATAIPKEPKGCPAAASVWSLVSYVHTGPYQGTSLYQFYWSHPEAVAAFAAQFPPGTSEEDLYFILVQIVEPVDRNDDDSFCIWWIGGNPGLWDGFISIVDNNSNAQH